MPRKKPAPPPQAQSSSAQLLPNGRYLHKYGIETKHPLAPLEVELVAANRRVPVPETVGVYRHYRNAINMLWPGTKWNSFMERQVQSFAESDWNAWVGMGACGKTHVSMVCAMVWWLMDPNRSSVVMTSTTAKMIRRRAWPVLKTLFHDCNGGFYGNMVDSKTTLQSTKGDDKHGLFAQAVAEGPVETAVKGIKGVHSSRMLVIIDEAEETPGGIFEALSNLIIGTTEFKVLLLYNPGSRYSGVGTMSEPADGWGSITIEDESWETKDQLNGKPMLVNRFDCERSPNILAGQTLFPFLVTQRQVDGAKRLYGEQSPKFCKDYRGWWPTDGMVKTIFSETEIMKFDGFGKHIFIGKKFFMAAGFDPAFGGGDRPQVQFGEIGDIHADGTLGVQLTESVKLTIQSNSTNPIGFQLAEQLQRECDARKVDPSNVAIDNTGEGGTLCDIITRLWSNRIIRVEFGGRPSDLPCSDTDIRLASEVYKRKNVELWYQARLFLLAGQLKGMTPDLAKEFCNRTFDDMGPKIELQLKTDMKAAFGRSPDLADACTLLLEVARQRGATIRTVASPNADKSSWVAKLREFDKVNDTDADYEHAQRTGYYGSFIVAADG